MENIIFIILNLVFLAILITFIFAKANSGAVLEEKYSKEIALMIDNAEPGMQIQLDMADAISVAQSNKIPLDKVVQIQGNIVNVNLDGKGGYSYSFFNDVKATVTSYGKGYIISINQK